jgi:hypothetical protein
MQARFTLINSGCCLLLVSLNHILKQNATFYSKLRRVPSSLFSQCWIVNCLFSKWKDNLLFDYVIIDVMTNFKTLTFDPNWVWHNDASRCIYIQSSKFPRSMDLDLMTNFMFCYYKWPWPFGLEIVVTYRTDLLALNLLWHIELTIKGAYQWCC